MTYIYSDIYIFFYNRKAKSQLTRNPQIKTIHEIQNNSSVTTRGGG